MKRTGLRCPQCRDGGDVRRSRFRWKDVFWRCMGMRPYRCLLCYRRFYTRRRLPCGLPTGGAKAA